MTSAPPFMHWYPQDHANKALDITRDDEGGLRLIIDALWVRDGKVPDNDLLLQRITKCNDQCEWLALKERLIRFFKIANGFWRNKRVDEELRIVHKRSKSASENANKRWQHKKKTNNADASVSHMPNGSDGSAPATAKAGATAMLDSESESEVTDSYSLSSTLPLKPPSRAKGAKRARRLYQPSPRMVQIEGFAHALAERDRNR